MVSTQRTDLFIYLFFLLTKDKTELSEILQGKLESKLDLLILTSPHSPDSHFLQLVKWTGVSSIPYSDTVVSFQIHVDAVTSSTSECDRN